MIVTDEMVNLLLDKIKGVGLCGYTKEYYEKVRAALEDVFAMVEKEEKNPHKFGSSDYQIWEHNKHLKETGRLYKQAYEDALDMVEPLVKRESTQQLYCFGEISSDDLSEQEENADDWIHWIRWEGGRQPVLNGQKVEIKLPSSSLITNHPEDYQWLHSNCGWDIIAYRIINEPEKEKIPTFEEYATAKVGFNILGELKVPDINTLYGTISEYLEQYMKAKD